MATTSATIGSAVRRYRATITACWSPARPPIRRSGGGDAAFANVIDNSSTAGIYLSNGAGNNLVQNNVIGIAPDGTTDEGNNSGIFVNNSPNNTLRTNYIGYSTGTTNGAIVLYGPSSYGNTVQQNYIGWDFYGTVSNGGAGIVVSNLAHDNTIGAGFVNQGFANIVRENAGPGVWLTASAGQAN